MGGLQQSEELTNTVMNEKGCVGYDEISEETDCEVLKELGGFPQGEILAQDCCETLVIQMVI